MALKQKGVKGRLSRGPEEDQGGGETGLIPASRT